MVSICFTEIIEDQLKLDNKIKLYDDVKRVLTLFIKQISRSIVYQSFVNMFTALSLFTKACVFPLTITYEVRFVRSYDMGSPFTFRASFRYQTKTYLLRKFLVNKKKNTVEVFYLYFKPSMVSIFKPLFFNI